MQAPDLDVADIFGFASVEPVKLAATSKQLESAYIGIEDQYEELGENAKDSFERTMYSPNFVMPMPATRFKVFALLDVGTEEPLHKDTRSAEARLYLVFESASVEDATTSVFGNNPAEFTSLLEHSWVGLKEEVLKKLEPPDLIDIL